jgi:hypothetical protein
MASRRWMEFSTTSKQLSLEASRLPDRPPREMLKRWCTCIAVHSGVVVLGFHVKAEKLNGPRWRLLSFVDSTVQVASRSTHVKSDL